MDEQLLPPLLVIFGISGDLAKRKLLPAIYHLLSENILPETTRIIGVSRRELNIDELLSSVELCVLEADNVCQPEGLQKLRNSLEFLQLDPTNISDFEALKSRLDELNRHVEHSRLFYMSIPPDAYAPIVENLAAVGLNNPPSRLLVEKPFGYDVASAKSLIKLINKHFDESQTYRIDHYLARETAQNLLTFRSNNPIFNSLWNAEHIEAVHIIAYETIGIEGRADFYEKTGAVRDLIQSHLMQLLALTLMDLPTEMTSQQIHRSKQYFLEQLKPADPKLATRGQYIGYRDEVNNSISVTETYAKVCLTHQAERWHGINIVLETGKALNEKLTEIVIVYKTEHDHPSNNLTFRIQPDEGVILDLLVKQPGLKNQLDHTKLDYYYKTSFTDAQHIDAYERVIIDALRGDQSLFASAAEVMATWQVLQPVIDDWQLHDQDLKFYPPGAKPDTIS